MAKVGKAVLLIAGTLFAIRLFGAIFNPQQLENRSPVDRIADGCKREFGSLGDRAEFECNVRFLNLWAADMERAKLDRVYRSSRQ